MKHELGGQVLRFLAVGGVGFVIDGGILWSLTAMDTNPFVARAISFPVAVVVTWLLNRIWTFSSAEKMGKIRQFGRYFGVQLVGSLTNYCIYAGWIIWFGESQETIMTGFVLGSALGAVVNFVGIRRFAFRFDQAATRK